MTAYGLAKNNLFCGGGGRVETLVLFVELILLRRQNHMSFISTCGCTKSFKESVLTKEQMSRCDHPRFRERNWVFNRGFVNQHVAVAVVAFHYILPIPLKQPGVFVDLVIIGFAECSTFAVSLVS